MKTPSPAAAQCVASLLLTLSIAAQDTGLRINEIVSSNVTGLPDEYEFDLQNCPVPSCPGWYRALGESALDGEYPDWIEIYNPGGVAVSLTGYGLSDSESQPMKWTFPEDVNLEPDGHLVVFASGKDKRETYLHTNFKISRAGETVVLSSPEGAPVDSIATEEIPIDFSYGRDAVEQNVWKVFSTPTPAEPNATTPFPGFTNTVTTSVAAGFHGAPVTVELQAAIAGDVIRYTLDGSVPGVGADMYAALVDVATTSVLRARSFNGSEVSSPVLTQTFLIDETVTMPVVSLSTDPDNLWDDDIGIYTPGPNAREGDRVANYWNDWERPVHVELFEPDGSGGFSVDAGIKILGWGSRSNGQKSFAIHLRDKYGAKQLDYPLFPGLEIGSFDAFVLRAAGGDSRSNGTFFRDPLASSLVEHGNVDKQAFRPAILFINGEYWGIQNIREKMNEDFLASHHPVDRDNVDMIQRYWRRRHPVIVEGDSDAFLALETFLDSEDMAAPGTYEVVQQTVDIDNFIDYMVTQIFCANYDWPGNNNKNWRPRAEEGKWRWLMYDLDYTFNSDSNNTFSHNTIRHATTSTGTGWPNPSWTILIPDKLLEIPEVQHRFANRFADLLNTDLLPERTTAKLDGMKERYKPEMDRHIARWRRNGGITSVSTWDRNIETVRRFLERRPDRVFSHLRSFFRFSGTGTLTVESEPENGGSVRLNSIKLDSFPWQGTYFEGVPVELQPLPAPGYRFAGWGGVENGEGHMLTTALPEDQEITVKAMFEPDPGALNAVIINEINYHALASADSGDWVELFNGWNVPVDLDGWEFRDNDESHYFRIPVGTVVEPGEYLVLCGDKDLFQTQYPNVTQCIGDFPFGLGNSGDTLRLFDFTGNEVDTVSYQDSAPWPVEPDGSGATLSLRGAASDNATAASWAASVSGAGSPGMENDVPPAKSLGEFRFSGVTVAPDGVVTLVLPTTAGRTYSVQKSGDLASWAQWKQATGTGVPVEFVDELGSGNHFYRAVESE
ncbi:MAG: hypothetical protein ACI9R3_001207 [Verrucomicrobiales bacterium]|jgi:hypothetical protein